MKRTLLCLLLCVLLLVPATSYAVGENLQSAQDLLQNASRPEFAVLFTGDTNGQAEKSGSSIGYPLTRALLENSQTQYDALLLDSGNALADDGGKTIKIMNATGYHAAAIGTRDAALGIERLQQLAAIADFPLLCANWLRDDGEELFEPYVIAEIGDVRVGIIGLISPSIAETYPEITKGCNVYDPAPIAQIYYDEMQQAGCTYYIALTSFGYDGAYSPRDLGAKCKWLNLILDSNTVTPLDHGELVENTNIIAYNLAPDFAEIGSLIVSMGEASNTTSPSTLTLDKLSSLNPNKDVQKVIDTDYEEAPIQTEEAEQTQDEQPADESTTSPNGKVTYSFSGTGILLVCLLAVTLAAIIAVAVISRKKQKK